MQNARAAKLSICVALGLMLQACAAAFSVPRQTGAVNNVHDVVAKAEAYEVDFDKQRNNFYVAKPWLELPVIGFAIAGAAALAYDAHTDTVIGVALAGGSTKLFGDYLAPATKGKIYRDGTEGAACIRRVAEGVTFVDGAARSSPKGFFPSALSTAGLRRRAPSSKTIPL